MKIFKGRKEEEKKYGVIKEISKNNRKIKVYKLKNKELFRDFFEDIKDYVEQYIRTVDELRSLENVINNNGDKDEIKYIEDEENNIIRELIKEEIENYKENNNEEDEDNLLEMFYTIEETVINLVRDRYYRLVKDVVIDVIEQNDDLNEEEKKNLIFLIKKNMVIIKPQRIVISNELNDKLWDCFKELEKDITKGFSMYYFSYGFSSWLEDINGEDEIGIEGSDITDIFILKTDYSGVFFFDYDDLRNLVYEESLINKKEFPNVGGKIKNVIKDFVMKNILNETGKVRNLHYLFVTNYFYYIGKNRKKYPVVSMIDGYIDRLKTEEVFEDDIEYKVKYIVENGWVFVLVEKFFEH